MLFWVFFKKRLLFSDSFGQNVKFGIFGKIFGNTFFLFFLWNLYYRDFFYIFFGGGGGGNKNIGVLQSMKRDHIFHSIHTCWDLVLTLRKWEIKFLCQRLQNAPILNLEITLFILKIEKFWIRRGVIIPEQIFFQSIIFVLFVKCYRNITSFLLLFSKCLRIDDRPSSEICLE